MKANIITMVAVMLSLSSFAQIKWKADPAHSSIRFEVTHLAISTVSGSFSDFDCVMESKKNTFDNAKIDAKIKVNSVSTENVTRDKHLKEDDFFNAELFPVMSFTSESFVKKSDEQYVITGWLTIRDVKKKITFPAEHSGIVSLGNKTISVFKADFSINRFDYKLTWDDTIDAGGLIVGEDVKVMLNLELVKM